MTHKNLNRARNSCNFTNNPAHTISNLTSVERSLWYLLSVETTQLIHSSAECGCFLDYQLSVRRELHLNLPRHVLQLLCSLLVSWEGEKKGEDRPEGWSRCQFAGIYGTHVRPECSERSHAQAHVLDLRNTDVKLVIDHCINRCVLNGVFPANRSKICFLLF